MKELIVILLLMGISAYISYYFTSVIYFKKGLLAAQEKFKNIQFGEAIGTESLRSMLKPNETIGVRALNLSADTMTGNTGLGEMAFKPNDIENKSDAKTEYIYGGGMGYETMPKSSGVENVYFGKAHSADNTTGDGMNCPHGYSRTEINCPECRKLLINDGAHDNIMCSCGWKLTNGNFKFSSVQGYPARFQDANGKPHPPFQLEDVMNKRVRYKNGNEYVIVGGDEEGLLNKSDNGNTCGCGRLEDIEEIIE